MKFFAKHKLDKDDPDDRKKRVKTILDNQTLKTWVDSWANQSDKNKEKALNFIKKINNCCSMCQDMQCMIRSFR